MTPTQTPEPTELEQAAEAHHRQSRHSLEHLDPRNKPLKTAFIVGAHYMAGRK